jgi:hypothetical protein
MPDTQHRKIYVNIIVEGTELDELAGELQIRYDPS